MRSILNVVYLVRLLEDKSLERGVKAEQIRFARDTGDITEDEALELALEYFSDPFGK